jgi:hypothetical protein
MLYLTPQLMWCVPDNSQGDLIPINMRRTTHPDTMAITSLVGEGCGPIGYCTAEHLELTPGLHTCILIARKRLVKPANLQLNHHTPLTTAVPQMAPFSLYAALLWTWALVKCSALSRVSVGAQPWTIGSSPPLTCRAAQHQLRHGLA